MNISIFTRLEELIVFTFPAQLSLKIMQYKCFWGQTLMKGLLQIVVALLLWVITLYILTVPNWMYAALTLLRGGIVFGIFFVGLAFFLLGYNELRN